MKYNDLDRMMRGVGWVMCGSGNGQYWFEPRYKAEFSGQQVTSLLHMAGLRFWQENPRHPRVMIYANQITD